MFDMEYITSRHKDFYNEGHTRSLQFRLVQLGKLKQLIENNEQALCQAVYQDLRRDYGFTKQLELTLCITEIDHFIKNLKQWMEPEKVEKTVLNALDELSIVKDPYGTVLLMSTWNFPALMCFFPLIPIIAAGNTVVLKCSENAPATSELVKKLIPQYFELDFITVVTGGPDVAAKVLEYKFDKIMYTGSHKIGKIIMEAASKHLTPCVLELGGKCPVVVLPDCDVAIAARRIVWGKLLNVGQVCITADYLLVHPDILDQFLLELNKSVIEYYGDEVQKSKDYCRIINELHFNRLNDLLMSSKGHIALQYGKPNREDLYFPPTVVQIGPNDPLMGEEIFGPIIPILSVQSLDDAIRFINSRPAPLAAYVFSKSQKYIDQFIHKIPSGAIVANDLMIHFFADTLPFGGRGNSGMGAYRGKFGFDEFTHSKSVIKKGYFAESLAESRYPPYDKSKYRRLAFVMARRDYPPALFKLIGRNWFTVVLSMAIGVLMHKFKEYIPFMRYF